MLRALGRPAVYTGLIIWTLLIIVPLVYMLLSSFKTHGEILRAPFSLPNTFSFENYYNAIFNTPLGQNFINSLIVTGGSLLILIIVTLFAGYALSRFPFPGNKVLLVGLFFLLAMPIHALVIPIYYFMDLIEARNNLFAIILLYATIHLPISIIIMRSYFESLPVALEEAAMIDGCNRIKVFFYVALPLAKVAIATIAIINVVGIWSEFLFASVLLTQPDARTLPIAIATLGVGQAADYGLRFAGLSLATIPMLLVYFLFSKKIVKGVMAGSVK